MKFLREKYEKDLEQARSNSGETPVADPKTMEQLVALEKQHENLLHSLEEEKSRCEKFKTESQSLQEWEMT